MPVPVVNEPPPRVEKASKSNSGLLAMVCLKQLNMPRIRDNFYSDVCVFVLKNQAEMNGVTTECSTQSEKVEEDTYHDNNEVLIDEEFLSKEKKKYNKEAKKLKEDDQKIAEFQ